ncbi:UNVERIFIED_CONTAM: hypothetical protein RMT77_000137 [Armadillidium vulgare]
MPSLYKFIFPDLVGSVFIILDLVADIAALVHLKNHNEDVLFYIGLGILIFTFIFINILAAIGIEELGDELSSPELRILQLNMLTKKNTRTRLTYFFFGIFGLLPHILVFYYFLIVIRNKKYGNELSTESLSKMFKREGAATAVKEVQSVLESGFMIYIKSFYIFLDATLYTQNWPLLFGFSVNVLSFFFGLRKDYVTVRKWKSVGFLIAVVNMSLRVIIILVLAKAAERDWVFFVPLAGSVILIFAWGLWLLTDSKGCPNKFKEFVQDSKPKNFLENCMSSFMYTLFLVPVDLHTAISIPAFTASSFAIAGLSITPVGLRYLLPFAGTLGQIPPKFWWYIFRIEK